jgi:hypothetical protein
MRTGRGSVTARWPRRCGGGGGGGGGRSVGAARRAAGAGRRRRPGGGASRRPWRHFPAGRSFPTRDSLMPRYKGGRARGKVPPLPLMGARLRWRCATGARCCSRPPASAKCAGCVSSVPVSVPVYVCVSLWLVMSLPLCLSVSLCVSLSVSVSASLSLAIPCAWTCRGWRRLTRRGGSPPSPRTTARSSSVRPSPPRAHPCNCSALPLLAAAHAL